MTGRADDRDSEQSAVVLYTPGRSWDPQRSSGQHRERHRAYLRQWIRSGAGQWGGLLLPSQSQAGCVGLVVADLSVADAELMAAGDPAVQDGMLAAEVLPFFPVG